jgi:DinB superfamily
MRETERIADQLKRAFYGEAWSGPCVKEVLENVTPEVAAMGAVPGAHSIWELVHHIEAWVNIVRRRVNGETFTVTPETNFPPVSDMSETAWKTSVKSLENAEEQLRDTILHLSEKRLDEPAVAGGDSVYVLLHGAVQHSLYHAGQIALLRKAAAGRSVL